MKKLYTILSLIFTLNGLHSFSQTTDRLPCLDKTFSIVAHIFKDSLGDYNITEPEVLAAVNSINVYFEPICARFEVCEFQYHDNYQYDMHDTDLDWAEMQVLYHVKNRINIYYVNDISEPSGVCGYAGLGSITNMTSSGIVIQKSGGCCSTDSKTHAHEMGHYFGLEHTFMDIPTTELVDGSNCATTADGICDTPADPYVHPQGMTFYVLDCRFINMSQDANGDYYDPLVGNIMSYYPDECACGFTHDQLKLMAETFLSNPTMW